MPKIYLIPTLIAEIDSLKSIAPEVLEIIPRLRCFFVENEKSARSYLKRAFSQINFQDVKLYPLSEHTLPREVSEYVDIIKTHDCGIISEAGCPGVADPGSDLVFLAHKNNIDVIPLVGPSSILLALMASGLNGQNFAFNGYLPKDEKERHKKIKQLEKRSFDENQTQIFMETPYRTEKLFDEILKICEGQTFLSLALHLHYSDQLIKTQTLDVWKKAKPKDINKKPAVFLLHKMK